MEKFELKKGDKVKYAVLYSDGDFKEVFCEVTEEPEDVNYPSVELSNGHTARWDGTAYYIEDMHYILLMRAYPELDEEATRIYKELITKINQRAQAVESKMPYKAQYIAEVVLRKLEESI